MPPPEIPPEVHELLAVLRQLLDRTAPERARFETTPLPVADAAAAGSPPLKRVHRRLIAAATDTPVPRKKLIGLAGYKVNAWSRDEVTFLLRHHFLSQGPDGITRGPRPAPPPGAG